VEAKAGGGEAGDTRPETLQETRGSGLPTTYHRYKVCWQHRAGRDEHSDQAALDFITVVMCKATSQSAPVRTPLVCEKK